jgi:hypothetical protein
VWVTFVITRFYTCDEDHRPMVQIHQTEFDETFRRNPAASSTTRVISSDDANIWWSFAIGRIFAVYPAPGARASNAQSNSPPKDRVPPGVTRTAEY